MANDEPFRFLDLPEELRLMVYDCLPTKTTHHDIDTEGLVNRRIGDSLVGHFIGDTRRVHVHGGDWLVESIKMVQKTMGGLAILATCQQIASDAGAILHTKLRAISEGLAQIVTNSVALDSYSLRAMIGRFQFASSGRNLKHLINPNHRFQK
jgi:hypothetical protein